MIKQLKKIHKDATNLAEMVAQGKHEGITEDELDTLAEVIEILNNAYEKLYDNVFVEIKDLQ
jgi:O-phosphoseryl-tRNA(Cys) synthetase